MKALLITAVPCETVRKLRPDVYLGYKIGDCGYVEHMLISRGRLETARRKCDECVLGQLVRNGHLLAPPNITREGLMRFIVSDTRESRRVLKRFDSQVVSVEETDLRSVALTPRQREAVSLLATSGGNITGVARHLGISKTAAWKLVKKSIRKMARLHAG